MSEFSLKDIKLGSSVFWGIIVLLAILWLSFLAIWSYQNDSARGGFISAIFFFMIISGVVLSRFKIFEIGTWKENSIGFTVGFLFFGAINGFFGTQSILSVTENHLFATISGQLPQFIDVLMNGIVVPIAEEIFWMFAIPFTIIGIMNVIGEKYGLFSNGWLQIIVSAIVSSVTFAFFHVGREANPQFIISAIIFRSMLIFFVFGEQESDLLKKFVLTASFSIGAHIANNVFKGGARTVVTVLMAEPVVASITFAFFGAIFITSGYYLIQYIRGVKTNG